MSVLAIPAIVPLASVRLPMHPPKTIPVLEMHHECSPARTHPEPPPARTPA